MQKLLLAAFIALAMEMPPHPLSAAWAEPSISHQTLFPERVLKSLGTTPPRWKEITFDEISKRRLRLTLVYQQMPSNLREVENDTKRIAGAVLKVLVEDGRKPHEEWISVFVHAHIPEKGVTGANLVRVFGKTMYNFNNDQLEFKPATK